MTGAEIAGKADRARDIDTARPAEAKPFLDQQIENNRQSLGIGDLIGLVDLGSFEIGGDATLADLVFVVLPLRLLNPRFFEREEGGADRAGEPVHRTRAELLAPH